MQVIEQSLPNERKYWRDYNYHFYTLKNPAYLEARKQSEVIRQKAREVYGRKYEQVSSNLAVIGDPIEKARIEPAVLIPAPPVPAPAAPIIAPAVPLPEAPQPEGEAAKEELKQKVYKTFVKTVEHYAQHEGNKNLSLLTARVNAKGEVVVGGNHSIPITITDIGPNNITINIKGKSERFINAKVFILFASNKRKELEDLDLPNEEKLKFANLMYQSGLLKYKKNKYGVDELVSDAPKAVYLDHLRENAAELIAQDIANKPKSKGKSKDTSSKTGAGFSSVEYYSGPDQLVERLSLLIRSINAGNNSLAVRNEGMSLLEKLRSSKDISPAQFNKLIKYFV